MTEQKINFTIGSSFSGEGFKRARGAVKEVNGGIKESIRNASDMAGAFGGLDQSIGKTAKAMSGLLGVFTSGNPVMIGISLVTSAISMAMTALKEAEEEAAKKADELRKKTDAMLLSMNSKDYEETIEKTKTLGDEYDRITKHAQELTAAIQQLNGQQGQTAILQLLADKVVAIFDQITEDGKKVVEAEYNLKIATELAALMRTDAETKVQNAHQAIIDQEGKLANLSDQRIALETTLKKLEERSAIVKGMDNTTREKVLKQIQDTQKKIDEIDKKIISGKDNLEVLLVKELTAIEQRTQADIKATTSITEAEEKQKALNDAIEMRRVAEEQQVLDAEIEANKKATLQLAEDDLAEQLKLDKEALENLNNASKKLKDAETNLATALQNYQAHYTENKFNEGVLGSQSDNMGNLGIDWSGIQSDVVQNSLRQAIENGQVNTVKGLNNLQKQFEREARDNSTRYKAQLGREKQRYDQLLNKNPKLWSKQDKDFYDKFNKIAKKSMGGASAVKDAREAYEEALKEWEAQKKQAQNIAEILSVLKDGVNAARA